MLVKVRKEISNIEIEGWFYFKRMKLRIKSILKRVQDEYNLL